MKLEIKNASVTLGVNEILKGVDFEINEGEKIAIVGRNGSGKTTLLRLISGEIEPDGNTKITKIGKVEIGYLHQISFEDENETLEGEILKIFKPILELKKKLKSLETALETNPTEKILNDYVATEHNYELMGGYTLEKSYNLAFSSFGFSESDKTKKLCEFSGGQKTKIALIKLLFLKPDILILDEPTNHLDTDAILWLEDYLKAYKKSLIIVSHDRAFIDNIANIVYEVENGKTKKYVGNYTEFVKTKKENYLQQLKLFESYNEEKNRLQAVADRFRYKATKAKMAQSKLKQIEKMEVVEAPEQESTKNFRFKFDGLEESGLEVIKLEKLVYGYDKPLGEISAKIYKGDRVAIVGGNGLGKSTLIKTIMGIVPLLGGKIKFGTNINVGYFDQQTITIKNNNNISVLDDFLAEFPDFSTEEARTKLGSFLFSGEDVFKKVNSLSGGERVRLELLKIFLKMPNVLILDEPTNHMDIMGRERLEEILDTFEGTIIFVSHDRYFVRKIANGIIYQTANGVEYFKGLTYNEFLTKTRKVVENLNSEKSVLTTKAEKPQSDYKIAKEKQKRIKILERDIKRVEEKIAELNAQYNAPENCSNVEVLINIQTEIEQQNELLNTLMAEWIDAQG